MDLCHYVAKVPSIGKEKASSSGARTHNPQTTQTKVQEVEEVKLMSHTQLKPNI